MMQRIAPSAARPVQTRVARRSCRDILLLTLLGAFLITSPVRGEGADPAPAVESIEGQATTAAVVIDGVELFQLCGAGAYPAERRAAEVAGRIASMARNRSIDASTIRVEGSELGPRVTVGDGSLTIVTAIESDARREAITQHELAAIYVHRIKGAVTSHRELRTPGRLLRATGWLLGATALLVLLWFGLRQLFRRLDRVTGLRLEAAVDRLRIQSFRLFGAEQALRTLRVLLRALHAAVLLVLLYIYLNSTLGLFPWTRGFALGMLDLVLDPLSKIGSAIVAAVPDLIFLAVLVLVTRLILRAVHLFFLEIERGAVRFEQFAPEWAMPTYRLVRLGIIAFAAVVAFPYIPGSSSGAFKGVSLFVGVLFSLGSPSVIGNVIAGYTMTYRRAFRDGDWIQVGEVVGDVTGTRLLVTTVRTIKNEEVVIPNSLILASPVVNYSAYARKSGLILHTSVGIGYEVPWRQVEAMLLMAASRTEGLLREPAPFVLQKALGDFAVTYEINAPCETPGRMAFLYSELHRHILDVFNEYGVQIMTPAYERDTPEPKVVPRAQWHAAPAVPPAPSE